MPLQVVGRFSLQQSALLSSMILTRYISRLALKRLLCLDFSCADNTSLSLHSSNPPALQFKFSQTPPRPPPPQPLLNHKRQPLSNILPTISPHSPASKYG